MELEKYFSDGCMKAGNNKAIPFPGTYNDFLKWLNISKKAFESYRFDQIENRECVKKLGLIFIGARKHADKVVFQIRTTRHKKVKGLRTDKDEVFTGRPMDNYNDACKAALIVVWEMITRRLTR